MGSYTFKWDRPANTVVVTGDFDHWAQSVRLPRTQDSSFAKLVELPDSKHKIAYKFVVDGQWTLDPTAPQETDAAGNTNNILHPSSIHPTSSAIDSANISTVTPQSTTTSMAAQVPKTTATPTSNQASSAPSSSTPPQPELAAASSDLPGTFPETPATEPQSFSVKPIPATPGLGNPIKLKPGEPVPDPSTLTKNTIQSTVQHPGSGVQGTDKGKPSPANMSALPDGESQTKRTIPEAGLPMADPAAADSAMAAAAEAAAKGPTVQSAGPETSTAALAGKVPLEPRGVPTVVEKSQEAADASPEASSNPTAVAEKAAVEAELEKKVPTEPPTSETTLAGQAAALASSAAAGVTAVAAGAAAYVSSGQAADDAKATLPESTHGAIDQAAATAGIPSSQAQSTSETVPDVVKESIGDAHSSPEAAANATAVAEKAKVEQQILSQVKEDESKGLPAPSAAAATAGKTDNKITNDEFKAAAEAGAANKADSAAGEAKNVTPAAATTGTSAAAAAAAEQNGDSRDISPMTRPGEGSAAATGADSSAAATEKGRSASTSSGPPASPSAGASKDNSAENKRSKRTSQFFQRLKTKFESKKN